MSGYRGGWAGPFGEFAESLAVKVWSRRAKERHGAWLHEKRKKLAISARTRRNPGIQVRNFRSGACYVLVARKPEPNVRRSDTIGSLTST